MSAEGRQLLERPISPGEKPGDNAADKTLQELVYEALLDEGVEPIVAAEAANKATARRREWPESATPIILDRQVLVDY